MSWEARAFLDVVKDVTGGNLKTKQKEYAEHGAFPIIDQGQPLIGGYTDDEDKLCKAELPVIIFGDHTKAFKFVDFPFCLGADGTKVLRPKNGADPKYLYYALQTAHIPDAGYSRHFKYLKAARIPLPPLEEQRRIAAILDQADALRRLRQRTIRLLEGMKTAVFHQMVSQSAEKRPLGSIIKVGSGNGLTAKNMRGGDVPVYGGNGINGWHDEAFVDPDTVIIGRVGVYCGAVHVTEKRAWVTDNALIVKKLVDIETDYLAEALRDANLNQYAGRSAQPLVSGSRIYPVEIPVPPIKDQQQFASKAAAIAGKQAALLRSLDAMEVLFGALQHRAFQGEL